MIIKNGKRIFVGFDGGSVFSCLQGEIDISYEDLVKKLGEPNAKNDGYKTDAEWEVETPSGSGTIYNYKDGKNYCGDDGLEVEDIRDWHIGGANKQTAEYIIKELLK